MAVDPLERGLFATNRDDALVLSLCLDVLPQLVFDTNFRAVCWNVRQDMAPLVLRLVNRLTSLLRRQCTELGQNKTFYL